MKAKDFREIARNKLKGNWGAAVGTTVVFLLLEAVYGIIAAIPVEYVNGIIAFLYQILVLNIVLYSYNVLFYINDKASVGGLFHGFDNYGKVFVLSLLSFIYTFLWSCLLVIPGIIKYYSYIMAPYILEDDPSLGGNAAITKSKEMMKGHRWELFCLQLSFIGWGLLTCLTCGIGSFWLLPYMAKADAEFYNNLKNPATAEATTEA